MATAILVRSTAPQANSKPAPQNPVPDTTNKAARVALNLLLATVGVTIASLLLVGAFVTLGGCTLGSAAVSAALLAISVAGAVMIQQSTRLAFRQFTVS